MSLGENIRRARLSCSMTQASLAQALNVSDRAVSRWERSVSMPDASLLPQLALVLRTSTDALLGVDPQRIQADIFQTIDTCTMLLREHKVTEAIALLRKKAAQYPQQPELMVALARALLKLKTEAAAQESLSLCRSANLQLPAGSPAQPLRLSTIFGSRQVMALALKHLGKREQAAQLVTDEMPAIFVSRELLLARVAPPEQAQRICRSNADLLGTLLQSTLLRLASNTGDPAYATAAASIQEALSTLPA
ncbi:MAG: helix-turn-helix transcriptional regulator [Clostridia bacterium]|nr:helix-turn-helix transcriptional regulator [Clostridia bacterium]